MCVLETHEAAWKSLDVEERGDQRLIVQNFLSSGYRLIPTGACGVTYEAQLKEKKLDYLLHVITQYKLEDQLTHLQICFSRCYRHWVLNYV